MHYNCPFCTMTSHSRQDAQQRYCARCNWFEDDWMPVRLAPKGEWITGHRAGPGQGVASVRWRMVGGLVEWIEQGTGRSSLEDRLFLAPTHWRPIAGVRRAAG